MSTAAMSAGIARAHQQILAGRKHRKEKQWNFNT
jgi:hypothetical protein